MIQSHCLLIIGPLPPPFIGPAAATLQLINSITLNSYFTIRCIDVSDRHGLTGIGQFNIHNVSQALYHYGKFMKSMSLNRPDVIYISIARGFWGVIRDATFLITARIFKIPTVVHLRAGRFDIVHDDGWLGKYIAKRVLSGVTQAVVLSENLKSIFLGAINKDKIRVVANGIDLSDDWDDQDVNDNTIFTILCLANMFQDKGTHILIQAAALLLNQKYHFQVIFAGDWVDTTYKDYCMRLIEEHRLQDYTRFVGVVDGQEKKKTLRSADIVVFTPTKPEGMPWVVLEAMAASKPVIGTRQGAMPEMIQHGETGLLIAADNPQELADSICQFIQHPELKAAMGSNARRRIDEYYNTSITHQQLLSVLQEAINTYQKK
ncbi:MAG: glycosyltransferase family 4 protein [Armatimonadetes bacterium]|nr:glycosyltransferase family 4 protein [Armatimonadota bacterium]